MGLRILNLFFGDSIIWQKILKTLIEKRFKDEN